MAKKNKKFKTTDIVDAVLSTILVLWGISAFTFIIIGFIGEKIKRCKDLNNCEKEKCDAQKKIYHDLKNVGLTLLGGLFIILPSGTIINPRR